MSSTGLVAMLDSALKSDSAVKSDSVANWMLKAKLELTERLILMNLKLSSDLRSHLGV